MPLFQALQHLLRLNLITLRAPPRNPNISAPNYHPNRRCAYHSDSPGHDTADCWALKNKVQDLINEGVVDFTQGGQAEYFYHPCRIHHLKWRVLRLEHFCSFECSICNLLLIVQTFIHVKRCYFINASHMSALNQYIRIRYIQTAFIFCDVQTLN